jgi:xanthine dehydrogenase accessory factor
MIGSKRKVALIRENFIESGLATEEEFDRVFAPIGLDIGAVTVPEIAASITAELVALRRKGIAHKPPTKMDQT